MDQAGILRPILLFKTHPEDPPHHLRRGEVEKEDPGVGLRMSLKVRAEAGVDGFGNGGNPIAVRNRKSPSSGNPLPPGPPALTGRGRMFTLAL